MDVMIILKYILKRKGGTTWNRYFDVEKRRTVVNKLMDLRFIQNPNNFLTRVEPVS